MVSTEDGKRIPSGSHDGTVRVWDRGEERRENLEIVNDRLEISAVDVRNVGKRVVHRAHDGILRIFYRAEGGE